MCLNEFNVARVLFNSVRDLLLICCIVFVLPAVFIIFTANVLEMLGHNPRFIFTLNAVFLSEVLVFVTRQLMHLLTY